MDRVRVTFLEGLIAKAVHQNGKSTLDLNYLHFCSTAHAHLLPPNRLSRVVAMKISLLIFQHLTVNQSNTKYIFQAEIDNF